PAHGRRPHGLGGHQDSSARVPSQPGGRAATGLPLGGGLWPRSRWTSVRGLPAGSLASASRRTPQARVGGAVTTRRPGGKRPRRAKAVFPRLRSRGGEPAARAHPPPRERPPHGHARLALVRAGPDRGSADGALAAHRPHLIGAGLAARPAVPDP